MVAALILSGLVLIVGAIVVWETGDLLLGRLRKRPHEAPNAPPPFLVVPTEDTPVNFRPTPVGEYVAVPSQHILHEVAVPLSVSQEPGVEHTDESHRAATDAAVSTPTSNILPRMASPGQHDAPTDA